MTKGIACLIFSWTAIILCSCDRKTNVDQPSFTKVDSLTDIYLSFQDSMLTSWNVMINDDNQKIEAMHDLLHELMVTSSEHNDLHAYEEQLHHLTELRYDQKTIAEEDLIAEYDFASNLLVTELISEAESNRAFGSNGALQNLVEEIRIAELRVSLYREDYDAITTRYNAFLKENHNHLQEITQTDSLELRPLFQMSYDD